MAITWELAASSPRLDAPKSKRTLIPRCKQWYCAGRAEQKFEALGFPPKLLDPLHYAIRAKPAKSDIVARGEYNGGMISRLYHWIRSFFVEPPPICIYCGRPATRYSELYPALALCDDCEPQQPDDASSKTVYPY